mgnify:CR=1 FL=1
MNTFTTLIRAINPKTGKLCLFGGPNIEAISMADAQHKCDTTGMGYCLVDAQLVSEVPCKGDSIDPDWDNEVNYQIKENN